MPKAELFLFRLLLFCDVSFVESSQECFIVGVDIGGIENVHNVKLGDTGGAGAPAEQCLSRGGVQQIVRFAGKGGLGVAGDC